MKSKRVLAATFAGSLASAPALAPFSRPAGAAAEPGPIGAPAVGSAVAAAGTLARSAAAPPRSRQPERSEICPCPCPPALAAEPGGDLAPRPTAEAFALNRAGRDLYRQRRWAEARERYRAALDADPGFLGPQLNLACAYAQEERFSEAVREATELARRAYVPWAREVREAADLAPLHGRPEKQILDRALADAGAAWGRRVGDGLLFVARLRPPVRLPAAGVLHLGLEQEIFSWDPASGRRLAVTADDGRVLGFARSPDGRTVYYLRAGKLVRSPGRPDRLRGLTVRRLDLPGMTLRPPVPLPGDLERVVLTARAAGAELVLTTGEGQQRYRFDGATLAPRPSAGDGAGERRSDGALPPGAPAGDERRGPTVLILDGSGAGLASPATHVLAGCRFLVRERRRAGSPPVVRIEGPGLRPFDLPGPHGSGVAGLPFP